MFGGYQPMANIMGIEEGVVQVVIDRGGERGVTGYVLCTVRPSVGLLASIFS